MFRSLGAALVFLAIQATFTAHLAPLISATTTVLTYATCFLTYAFVLFQIRKEAPTTALMVGLVVTALGIRLALAFAEPTLSDDIFRYVWEGRVTLAGYNPFVHAPSSEVLEALRDEVIWPQINHPDVPTIYPPISQMIFAGVALVGGGTTLMRLVFIALEVLAVAAAWHLVGDHPRRLFGLALYALNPLVMLEVAWSGHLDVVAWAALTLALLVVATRRGAAAAAGAGVLFGVSIGAKLLGVLLIPYLFLRRRGDDEPLREALRDRAVMLACAAGVVFGSYAVFIDAGPKLFGGFGTYAAAWRSNDGVFRGWDSVSWITLQQGEPQERIFEFPEWNELAVEHGFTKEWEGRTLPDTSFATNQLSQTVAKFAAAIVVGIALLFCIFAVRDPLIAALVVLLTLYLVAPTVHPWYVAWLVPLAALRPNATSLVFSGAVLAAYVAWMSYDNGGAWLIPWWVVTIEVGLVLAVLVWEIGRLRFRES